MGAVRDAAARRQRGSAIFSTASWHRAKPPWRGSAAGCIAELARLARRSLSRQVGRVVPALCVKRRSFAPETEANGRFALTKLAIARGILDAQTDRLEKWPVIKRAAYALAARRYAIAIRN